MELRVQEAGTEVGWLEEQVTKDKGNWGKNSIHPGGPRGKHPGLGKDARSAEGSSTSLRVHDLLGGVCG